MYYIGAIYKASAFICFKTVWEKTDRKDFAKFTVTTIVDDYN